MKAFFKSIFEKYNVSYTLYEYTIYEAVTYLVSQFTDFVR